MTAAMLHFEDFPTGETVTYGSYTLTREAILEFAGEYDPQPFHLDETAAETSLLGGLAASGWHACAIMMRLNCDGFLLDATSMGAPGIDEVKWLAPLRPGAVLSVRRTTLDSRASKSRPEMGLVKFLFELLADGEAVVMTQACSIMFGRRAA
ncbi:MaoC family dehydratase [Labrys monachus]|uniref:Acyl dehydratase n=1 Tax=Labrys monachus TaxID=217067 RepID=A0ABU0FKM2_9HYPH|nr:MaoC family dehydratase [Labrys monachus]MDQ0394664.1 acyl dehydratase [Labrys monachus]